MKKYQFQLYLPTGKQVSVSGGVCQVCTASDTDKPTIYNAAGTAISNPLSLTYGGATFYTADTVNSVDLYIMDGAGRFVVAKGVTPGDIEDIFVNTNPLQRAVIPFDVTYQTGDATETDSGFDIPVGAIVLPLPAIQVTTVDATETIDVGLLSSETAGDADGFIVAASVATAGTVKGTAASAGNTMGALFEVQDSANAGDIALEGHVVTGSNATSVTWTLTTGSDTAEGFILLPYLLPYSASQV